MMHAFSHIYSDLCQAGRALMVAVRDACSSVVLPGARVVALALAGVVQAPTVAVPVHVVLLTVFPEVATMA